MYQYITHEQLDEAVKSGIITADQAERLKLVKITGGGVLPEQLRSTAVRYPNGVTLIAIETGAAE